MDFSDCIAELLCDGLSFESIDGIRVGRGGHDDKGDDSDCRACFLQLIVEASERFDKHVHALVPVLVTTGSKQVDGIIKIKVVVAIEMTTDKLVDLGLGGGMKVLKFMHGLKFDDVETVGKDSVGFAFEEMLAFVGCDVRNGGKDVGAVGSRTFDAVSVVDTAFSGLVVDVKVLEIVVKVDRACTEISAQEGGMGGEHRGDIDMTFATEGDGEASLPFVKVGDDGGGQLAGDVLQGRSINKTRVENSKTHIAQEPSDEVAKDDGLVCLVVVGRAGDASEVPEIGLPLVEAGVHAAGIKEKDLGVALDEPATVESLDALGLHGLESGSEMGVTGLLWLDLHRRGLVGERADEAVSVAKLGDGDGHFGLDHRVDPPDLVRDFPRTFKQDGLSDIALAFSSHGKIIQRKKK